MKKLFAVILWSVLIFSLCCCSEEKESAIPETDTRIENAVVVLQEHWTKLYNDSKLDITDKYLEITNTKIINIKEEIESEEQKKRFGDIDYIVEFELQSNYYNMSPYYSNIGFHDTIVVYNDGKAVVEKMSPVSAYNRTATYLTGVSDFVESVENFHGEYDRIIEIK